MGKGKKLRTNERIAVKEVRLIDEKGNQLGIVPTEKALQIAKKRSLDLVEVASQAQPPVCKILDYDQYRYAQIKKGKTQKKKQRTTGFKEMRFSPRTALHDFESKLKKIREFLEIGNKVKLRLRFRGREVTRPEAGAELLQKVIDACKDIAQVEVQPRQEGRQMIAVLGPRSNS